MARYLLLPLVIAACGCQRQVVQTQSAGAFVVLAPPDEPGERLDFTGRVLDERGRPLAGAAVLAYHTDATGVYNRPGSGTRIPRLRGTAITNEAGGFRFATIRPAAYPDGKAPAHIHMSVLAPAHHVSHFEFWFRDDPLIRGRAPESTVIVELKRDAPGEWTFRHDIRLEGN